MLAYHGLLVTPELWLSFWSEVHYNSLYERGGEDAQLSYQCSAYGDFSCLQFLALNNERHFGGFCFLQMSLLESHEKSIGFSEDSMLS